MARRHSTTSSAPQRWYDSPRAIALLCTVIIVGLLALSMTGCGGGSAGAAPTPPSPDTLHTAQPGELLTYMRGKVSERQRLRAEAGHNHLLFSSNEAEPTTGAVFSAGNVSAPVERSGTVLQESGVEEDDLIKSDGNLIYTLTSIDGEARWERGEAARIDLHQTRVNGEAALTGTLTLLAEDKSRMPTYSGMYLAIAPQRLAVLGSRLSYAALPLCSPLPACNSGIGSPSIAISQPSVAVDLVSVSNATRPVLSHRLRLDGRLVGSRMIGNTVVLVTRFMPQVVADKLPWNMPKAERESALAQLTAADFLPTYSLNGGAAQPLVNETDCYINPRNASYGLEMTTITTIDLSSTSAQPQSRCFAGGSEAIYMSTATMYLATTHYAIQPIVAGGRQIFPTQTSTDIHKFALNNSGGAVTAYYRGSGTVPGHLGWSDQQRPFRMSEYQGDLRVLTYTGESGWASITDVSNSSAPPPSPATLSVLREHSSDNTLQIVGQLPNAQQAQAIGKPGEQVYAVRFVGERAYVVTFRRTDPLYVLDLSNPTAPKTSGELTVAGFSDYLFPIGAAGSNLLLGVGKDANEQGFTTGVKVALFDVADPAKPIQRNSATFGAAGSWAALNDTPHGIDLFTRGTQTRIILSVYSAAENFQMGSYALQRFEVDSVNRTMVVRPEWAQTANTDGSRHLERERTLQIGDKVYHFDGQQLHSYSW